MIVASKIKQMFPGELLRYIAAICDTRRIDSNRKKMITLGNLLYSNGIDFEILGGATNRIALQIDGYAVKFAMDEQGYKDNWVEYALSPELQPYVTKSYETNGYVLIAECVEVMTEESFILHKNEILKILDRLCNDYLLGDVGYIKKNMTNWGLRGGAPVILDYAYCHRATEGLFTCSQCGSILTYDSVYDIIMCTNKVGGCKARYTYNDRKRIQGDEVDLNMIRDRKSESIKLGAGIGSKEIELFEDRLIGDNYFVIDNPGDMHRYNKLKEEIMMNVYMNGGDESMMENSLEAMVDIIAGKNVAEAEKVLFQNVTEPEVPEPVYTDDYRDTYLGGYVSPMRIYSGMGEEESDDEGDSNEGTDFDMEAGLEALIDTQMQKRAEEEARLAQQQRDLDEANASAMNAYLDEKEAQQKEVPASKAVPKVTVAEQADAQEDHPVEEAADVEAGESYEEDGGSNETENTDGEEEINVEDQEGRYILAPAPDDFPEGENFVILDRATESYYAVDGKIVTFETPQDASQYLDELYESLPVDTLVDENSGSDNKQEETEERGKDVADDALSEESVEEEAETDTAGENKTEEASILVEGKPIQIGQEVTVNV